MSLNEHLRAFEDHAVLPFDPACPICRSERLAGRLPAVTLVSPRLTALAVAGITAGCTLAPAPAALAQEPPIELPPGGYEDPTEEAIEGEGPLVEDEPVESDVPDPNVPSVVTDDPALAIDPADPPPPVDPAILGGEPVPDVPAEDPPAAPVAPAPPPVPAAPVRPPPPAAQPAPPTRPAEPKRKPAPREQRAPAHSRAVSSPAPRPAPAPRPVTATSAAPVPVPAGSTYVVRPGDTLWSIAHARLGRDASIAAVSGLVAAIWRANAGAIRTGDPDLILPGTRLVLPGAPG